MKRNRVNKVGSAKSSRLNLTCNKNASSSKLSKTPESISKYFIQTKGVPENKNSSANKSCELNDEVVHPYESSLGELKPSMNSSLVDKNDFKSPELLRCMKKRHVARESANQAKVKVYKTKKPAGKVNSLRKLVEDNFCDGDTNGEHLQLAIALSKSMQRSEKETEEDPLPSCTSKQPRNILEEFGFQTSRRKTGQENKIISSDAFKKRKKSRYKYITPTLFLRTEEDREKLISTKISLILSNKDNHTTDEPQLQPTKLSNPYLRKFYSNVGNICRLNELSFDELVDKELFYLKNLEISPSTCASGYLLRDWNGIPGREATPPRKIQSFTVSNSLGEDVESYPQENAVDGLQYTKANGNIVKSDVKSKPLETCISPDLFDSDDEDSAANDLRRSINNQLDFSLQLIDNIKSKVNTSSECDSTEKPRLNQINTSFSNNYDSHVFTMDDTAGFLKYESKNGICHFEIIQDNFDYCIPKEVIAPLEAHISKEKSPEYYDLTVSTDDHNDDEENEGLNVHKRKSESEYTVTTHVSTTSIKTTYSSESLGSKKVNEFRSNSDCVKVCGRYYDLTVSSSDDDDDDDKCILEINKKVKCKRTEQSTVNASPIIDNFSMATFECDARTSNGNSKRQETNGEEFNCDFDSDSKFETRQHAVDITNNCALDAESSQCNNLTIRKSYHDSSTPQYKKKISDETLSPNLLPNSHHTGNSMSQSKETFRNNVSFNSSSEENSSQNLTLPESHNINNSMSQTKIFRKNISFDSETDKNLSQDRTPPKSHHNNDSMSQYKNILQNNVCFDSESDENLSQDNTPPKSRDTNGSNSQSKNIFRKNVSFDSGSDENLSQDLTFPETHRTNNNDLAFPESRPTSNTLYQSKKIFRNNVSFNSGSEENLSQDLTFPESHHSNNTVSQSKNIFRKTVSFNSTSDGNLSQDLTFPESHNTNDSVPQNKKIFRKNVSFDSESEDNLSQHLTFPESHRTNNTVSQSKIFRKNLSFNSASDGNLSQDSICISDEELNYSSLYTTSLGRNSVNVETAESPLTIDSEVSSDSPVIDNETVNNMPPQNLLKSTSLQNCKVNTSAKTKSKICVDDMLGRNENHGSENEPSCSKIFNPTTRTNFPDNSIDKLLQNQCGNSADIDVACKTPMFKSKNKYNGSVSDELIIKTNNVTPMPNYAGMDTPNITKELQKFGIKNLKRKRGIQVLRYIYDTTHPFVKDQELDSTSDNGDGLVKKRKKDDPKKSRKKLEVSYQAANEILLEKTGNVKSKECFNSKHYFQRTQLVGDLLQENEQDLIFEKKQSSKISSCQIPLHIAWHNLVSDHPGLLESILLYEPLSLEVLYSLLKEQGYKFSIQDLLTFLDNKCITIRTNQNARKNKSKKVETNKTTVTHL